MNVYFVILVNIVIEIFEFNLGVYNELVKKYYFELMFLLVEGFNIDKVYCYIEEGLLEDVIFDVVVWLNSELVVIGIVGCIGLSVVFVGNIVEYVIDSFDCDVLVLKLDGYVSFFVK